MRILCTAALSSLMTILAAGYAEAKSGCKLPGQISTDTQLDPACTYKGSLQITTSGITLDCRGATIDATGQKNGIAIRGDKLRDITVDGCTVINASDNAIYIGTAAKHQKLARMPKDRRYEIGATHVVIRNTVTRDADSSGIYVGAYSQDTVIDNVTVDSSAGVGMYLDYSSIRTSVTNSRFTENGGGSLTNWQFGPNLREGIAIDSSSNNVISGNVFDGNAGGGIYLYKNCHEYASSKKSSVERWMYSENNLIENNRFKNMPRGVWIASRMSRDLSTWECGDPYYGGKYVLDHAPHNTIRGNVFTDMDIAVRVEDDGNAVSDNQITAKEACVWIGTPARATYFGQPVIGSSVSRNSCETNGTAYRYSDGSQPDIFGNNLTNGAAAKAVRE